MIRNERDYRIRKAQVSQFRADLAAAADSPPPKGVHPKLHRHGIDALRVKLEELEADIKSYEELKSGRHNGRLQGGFGDLGELLVRARIARGWTQAQLAERLGLHEQKIQQYEQNAYFGASLTRITDVWRALGTSVTLDIQLKELPDRTELKTVTRTAQERAQNAARIKRTGPTPAGTKTLSR